MDDLIKRQDAIDAITKQTIYTADIIKSRCKARLVDENGWLGGLKDAIEAVEDVPSAQKTGRWKLLRKGNDTSDYECTNCLGILMDVENDDHHELQRYCGMCGARMEVYDDNN